MSGFDNDERLSVLHGRSPFESVCKDGRLDFRTFWHRAYWRIHCAKLSPSTSAAPKARRCQSSSTQQKRAAFRTHWLAAKCAAEAMTNAAEVADPMALTIAADDCDLTLAKLWELRDLRNVDWQTILNHAQGMLKQLFAEKRTEQLTAPQCRSIQALVDNHLGPSTKTTADLNEAIRLIGDAGCDPYWAISGDPANGEDNQPQKQRNP